jgi:hypothetical protein
MVSGLLGMPPIFDFDLIKIISSYIGILLAVEMFSYGTIIHTC